MDEGGMTMRGLIEEDRGVLFMIEGSASDVAIRGKEDDSLEFINGGETSNWWEVIIEEEYDGEFEEKGTNDKLFDNTVISFIIRIINN